MSREAAVKKIAVKSLTDKTNVPLLAGEIVEKCKLIHPSKASSVYQTTNELTAWRLPCLRKDAITIRQPVNRIEAFA